MRIATFAAAALAVVLALSACGSTTKYVAGTPQAAAGQTAAPADTDQWAAAKALFTRFGAAFTSWVRDHQR